MREIYSASPYMKLLKTGWPKTVGECKKINNTNPDFGDYFDVHYLVTLPQFKFLKGKYESKMEDGDIEGLLSRLGLRFRYAYKSHFLASYDARSGEIMINVTHVKYRSEDDISNLLVHELTHALQDFAKEQYQSFRGQDEYRWTTHEKEAYMTMVINMLANGKSEDQIKEYFVSLSARSESDKWKVRAWVQALIDAAYQEMEYREKPLGSGEWYQKGDGKIYHKDGTEVTDEEWEKAYGPPTKPPQQNPYTRTASSSLKLEVARTPEQRSMGFMFREDIPTGTGILFVNEYPSTQGLWMRNTPMPLSSAFLDEDGRIINIHSFMEPNTVRVYGAEKPAHYMVEVPLVKVLEKTAQELDNSKIDLASPPYNLKIVWKATDGYQTEGNLEIIRTPTLEDFSKWVLPGIREGWYKGTTIEEQYEDMMERFPDIVIAIGIMNGKETLWKLDDYDEVIPDVLNGIEQGWAILVNDFDDLKVDWWRRQTASTYNKVGKEENMEFTNLTHYHYNGEDYVSWFDLHGIGVGHQMIQTQKTASKITQRIDEGLQQFYEATEESPDRLEQYAEKWGLVANFTIVRRGDWKKEIYAIEVWFTFKGGGAQTRKYVIAVPKASVESTIQEIIDYLKSKIPYITLGDVYGPEPFNGMKLSSDDFIKAPTWEEVFNPTWFWDYVETSARGRGRSMYGNALGDTKEEINKFFPDVAEEDWDEYWDNVILPEARKRRIVITDDIDEVYVKRMPGRPRKKQARTIYSASILMRPLPDKIPDDNYLLASEYFDLGYLMSTKGWKYLESSVPNLEKKMMGEWKEYTHEDFLDFLLNDVSIQFVKNKNYYMELAYHNMPPMATLRVNLASVKKLSLDRLEDLLLHEIGHYFQYLLKLPHRNNYNEVSNSNALRDFTDYLSDSYEKQAYELEIRNMYFRGMTEEQIVASFKDRWKDSYTKLSEEEGKSFDNLIAKFVRESLKRIEKKARTIYSADRFYHATFKQFLPGILSEGLKDIAGDRGIYLASTPDEALTHWESRYKDMAGIKRYHQSLNWRQRRKLDRIKKNEDNQLVLLEVTVDPSLLERHGKFWFYPGSNIPPENLRVIEGVFPAEMERVARTIYSADEAMLEEIKERGGVINPDGTMDLYHATNKANAQAMVEMQTMAAPAGTPDSYGVYVSSSPDVVEDYGPGGEDEALVRVKVPVSDLHLDDAFPSGRMDFRIETKRGLYKPLSITMARQIYAGSILMRPLSTEVMDIQWNQDKGKLSHWFDIGYLMSTRGWKYLENLYPDLWSFWSSFPFGGTTKEGQGKKNLLWFLLNQVYVVFERGVPYSGSMGETELNPVVHLNLDRLEDSPEDKIQEVILHELGHLVQKMMSSGDRARNYRPKGFFESTKLNKLYKYLYSKIEKESNELNIYDMYMKGMTEEQIRNYFAETYHPLWNITPEEEDDYSHMMEKYVFEALSRIKKNEEIQETFMDKAEEVAQAMGDGSVQEYLHWLGWPHNKRNTIENVLKDWKELQKKKKMAAGPRQTNGTDVFCPMSGKITIAECMVCPYYEGIKEGSVACMYMAPNDEKVYPLKKARNIYQPRKIAGVLDLPHENLDEELWNLKTDNPTLDPDIKDMIIYKLKEWLDKQKVGSEWISGMYFIGSSAGYQYKDESDIDITVVPDLDKLHEIVGDDDAIKIFVRKMIRQLNEWKIAKHPVNYYIRMEASVPVGEAIYDMFSDIWIKAPAKIPKDWFPEDQYRDQFTEAEAEAGTIDEVIGRLRRRLEDHKILSDYSDDPDIAGKIQERLLQKEKSIDQWATWLSNEYKKLWQQRHHDYAESESQESRGNIIYKFLERYGYLSLMLGIRKLKAEGSYNIPRIRRLLKNFAKK